nr:RecName: Full=Conotoxin FVIA; Flags: Precursor [Conus fulmen]
ILSLSLLDRSTRCKGTGKSCSRIAYNCCTGSCRSGKCG